MNKAPKYNVTDIFTGETIDTFQGMDTAVSAAIGHGAARVHVYNSPAGMDDGSVIFDAYLEPEPQATARNARPIENNQPEVGDRYLLRSTATPYRIADIIGGEGNGAPATPTLYILRIAGRAKYGDQEVMTLSVPVFKGMFFGPKF